MCTLCLDPSLRAFGWAVIQDDDVIDCGCIVTKVDRTIKISDADTIALKTISSTLKTVLEKYSCTNIIFENSVGSKSSRANQSLAYVKGLVVSASVFYGVDFTTIRAKVVKKALTNDSDATKDQILEKVKENFKSFDKIVKDWPKFKVYAAADAAATYLGTK